MIQREGLIPEVSDKEEESDSDNKPQLRVEEIDSREEEEAAEEVSDKEQGENWAVTLRTRRQQAQDEAQRYIPQNNQFAVVVAQQQAQLQ